MEARAELASKLAATMLERLGRKEGKAGLSDEEVLEAVARSYRDRFARGRLMPPS